jgi:hypothetical protein
MPSTAINSPRVSPSAASVLACDYFFPPMFRALPVTARVPGGIAVLSQVLRVRRLHRLAISFGWVTKSPLPTAVLTTYLDPMRADAGVRRDLAVELHVTCDWGIR